MPNIWKVIESIKPKYLGKMCRCTLKLSLVGKRKCFVYAKFETNCNSIVVCRDQNRWKQCSVCK